MGKESLEWDNEENEKGDSIWSYTKYNLNFFAQFFVLIKEYEAAKRSFGDLFSKYLIWVFLYSYIFLLVEKKKRVQSTKTKTWHVWDISYNRLLKLPMMKTYA